MISSYIFYGGLFILMVVFCIVAVTDEKGFNSVVVQEYKISPPVDKILKILDDKDNFEVRPRHLGEFPYAFDYVLIDVVTSKKSYLNYYSGMGYAVVGDLEWMTDFEKEAVYKKVRSIYRKTLEIEEYQSKLSLQKTHEEMREKAKETYKNR